MFHFDVQGSVAKSTHAGIPWLRYIRQHAEAPVHFGPFDGWSVLPNRSVIAEVYPALWSRTFPSAGRTPDQQDAFAIANGCNGRTLMAASKSFSALSLTRMIARRHTPRNSI